MSEYQNYSKDENTEDMRECEPMRKIFVGGLNRETGDDTFFDHFSQFGNMIDKVVIRDNQTQQSKGFGFITFDKADAVENVFKNRPHVIDGKTLDVKRAMPKHYNNTASHTKTTKLFIGGISEELTPEDLQQYIESRHDSSCGSVEKIDFLKERETNKNKGFGFLECSSTDFADRLVICEGSFLLNGKKMSLKKAEPKEEGGRNRGGGRGRGRGGRGRGGGRGGNQQQNGGFNNYGQGYQQYDYSAQQAQYGGMGYGYNQQQGYGGQQQNYGGGYNQQSGWNNNRFQPY